MYMLTLLVKYNYYFDNVSLRYIYYPYFSKMKLRLYQ